MDDEFHKTERELLVKTTMQRVAARKSAPGSPEALAVSNSILIPIVPDILDIIVIMGSFIRKESSKIPLKINSFLCLRRFSVAFSLVWYVITLSVILSITELFLRVNPQQLFYCCTRLSVFLICIIVWATIRREKAVGQPYQKFG